LEKIDNAKEIYSSYLQRNPKDEEILSGLGALEPKYRQLTVNNTLKILFEFSEDLSRLEENLKGVKGNIQQLEYIIDDWFKTVKKSRGNVLYYSTLKDIGPRLAYIPARFKLAIGCYHQSLNHLIEWLILSKETTNFTYDLNELNKTHLSWFVSMVTKTDIEKVTSYIKELEEDEKLKLHVHMLTVSSDQRLIADEVARYGRRLGWYAFVRAKKPKIVIETGVDKGLGTCVLAAALMRNHEEGFTGHLYATDINKAAGYLFKVPYTRFGTIIYGDSIQTLNKFSKPIDIFIHDSDHFQEYEREEFYAITDKLSEDALIISDAAHHSKELVDFAKLTGRQFLYFQEKPKSHFYPGAGIGVAFYPASTIHFSADIDHFKKALKIDPNDRNAILNYGTILTNLEKLEDAKSLYSSYLQRNPKDEEILSALGALERKKLNNISSPQEAYEKLWKIKLNDPEWLKNDGKGRVEYCANFLKATNKIGKGTKLLDIGCGRGTLRFFLNTDVILYGVDISEKAVLEAGKIYTKADVVDLNAEKLPYEKNSIDIVTTLDVIEHVFDPLFCLREIYRVLKPGGQVVLSTPNILQEGLLKSFVYNRRFPKTSGDSFPYDGGHIHFFTYQDIFDLLKAVGFTFTPIGPLKDAFDYEFKEPLAWVLGKKI